MKLIIKGKEPNSLTEYKKKGTWCKSFLAKILKKYEGKDEIGKLEPYCGIIIWYLNKRI